MNSLRNYPKFSHKTIAIFSVTAVVVVVFVIFAVRGKPKEDKNGEQRAAFPPAQSAVVYAAKGEITPGFPKELILDTRASLTSSYAINYNESLNQYTTAFDSEQSMAALYDIYLAYFQQDGWTIVNAITKYPTSRGLYAKKGNTDASVAILDKDDLAQVMISYVVK
jgi:hypothetical protein